MRVIVTILSAVLMLGGVIWFLLGINVLTGTTTSGQTQWAIYGVIAFIAGVVLLLLAYRRKPPPGG